MFEYRGFKYKTYQHAYQAQRLIITESYDEAFLFTFESGSELSKWPSEDIRNVGKHIVDDKEVWNCWKEDLRIELLIAKYTQNEKARKELLKSNRLKDVKEFLLCEDKCIKYTFDI